MMVHEYENYEGGIVINEINYNPASSFDQSDTDYEFIEIYNNYQSDVDLSGWSLTSSNIDFTFGDFVLFKMDMLYSLEILKFTKVAFHMVVVVC